MELAHNKGEEPVRITKLLRKLIGIESLVVLRVWLEAGRVCAQVKPAWRRPRCSGCGKRKMGGPIATEMRAWRHLDLCGAQLWLFCDLRRVYCSDCGTLVEAVPWATDPKARVTDEFDEMAAFLAQRCDRTSVTRLLRTSWRAVGRCIRRVMDRLRPEDPLEGLAAVGVDEISYRKYHHYLTLVTDHDTHRIVWGKKGRNAETLAAFFEELGEEGRAQIKFVTADMSAAYMKAIRDAVPHAKLIFDRFHVQQLVTDALDETRREEWRRLKGTPEGKAIKNSRWALLKREVNASEADEAKLAEIQASNKPVYRGYLLTAQFCDILDRRQPNVVRKLLRKWFAWATRSRLPAFVKAARTIRQHIESIVDYIRFRYTNGPHEGQNTKVRLLTRRAYGFHSAEAVLAMIELCCSGLEIVPPHKAVFS